jgi:hypothetical protein
MPKVTPKTNMPPKMNQDTTPGVRLLRLFRKLMLDNGSGINL